MSFATLKRNFNLLTDALLLNIQDKVAKKSQREAAWSVLASRRADARALANRQWFFDEMDDQTFLRVLASKATKVAA